MIGPSAIALVDYGAGNLRSVENALREVGAEVVVTRDPDAVARADRVVVPGQGSMPECAAAMQRSGVADALQEAIRSGRPVLGICVGLQLLFEDGVEAGGQIDGLVGVPAREVEFLLVISDLHFDELQRRVGCASNALSGDTEPAPAVPPLMKASPL